MLGQARSSLALTAAWPVDNVAAAIVGDDGVTTVGDPQRVFRLASLVKPITAWAVMVAVEEGIVTLDGPLHHASAPEGATLRHALSHTAGFGFDGDTPVATVGQRRIYSNTGIECAAAEVAGAAAMPFGRYLRDAVFEPLGMVNAELRGSAAHGGWASITDMACFVGEMRRPRLIAASTYAEVTSIQFPALAGIVPGVGRFDPCPWGLGVEVRGAKSPHWTGTSNSASTFGHFGGSGTMMWFDPVIDRGVVALTDRPFDEWSDAALACWREFSDAVVADSRSAA